MLGCLASAPQLPDLLKELRIHHLAEGDPSIEMQMWHVVRRDWAILH
jgi:hypothetical protein